MPGVFRLGRSGQCPPVLARELSHLPELSGGVWGGTQQKSFSFVSDGDEFSFLPAKRRTRRLGGGGGWRAAPPPLSPLLPLCVPPPIHPRPRSPGRTGRAAEQSGPARLGPAALLGWSGKLRRGCPSGSPWLCPDPLLEPRQLSLSAGRGECVGREHRPKPLPRLPRPGAAGE